MLGLLCAKSCQSVYTGKCIILRFNRTRVAENCIGIFTEVRSNVLQLPSNYRRQVAHGQILLVEQITIKIAGEATKPLQRLE